MDGQRDRLGAICRMKNRKDVLQVSLHAILTDAHLVTDLPVGETLRQPA